MASIGDMATPAQRGKPAPAFKLNFCHTVRSRAAISLSRAVSTKNFLALR
jgi:hypothetical protein